MWLGKLAARIGPDGFTLKGSKVPMGHRIHYRYMVDWKSEAGSVVYSGDPDAGQMVFTGGRPSSVQVLAVTAPRQALPAEKPRPSQSQPAKVVQKFRLRSSPHRGTLPDTR